MALVVPCAGAWQDHTTQDDLKQASGLIVPVTTIAFSGLMSPRLRRVLLAAAPFVLLRALGWLCQRTHSVMRDGWQAGLDR